jgi:predicted RNA-binding protein with RPS1 domain
MIIDVDDIRHNVDLKISHLYGNTEYSLIEIKRSHSNMGFGVSFEKAVESFIQDSKKSHEQYTGDY